MSNGINWDEVDWDNVPAVEPSMAERIAMDPHGSEYLESIIAQLTEQELDDFIHDWSFWGRPDQQEPPGDWSIWLSLCGRGSGKTRAGSEWCHKNAKKFPGCRMAVIAPTAADGRDVLVEGESGILSTSPLIGEKLAVLYEPSKRRLTWPNGSIATIYSADEPRRLRGPQHHFVWFDELAAYLDPQGMFDMAKFGLRLPGKPSWPTTYRPRMMITTTPLPIEIIRRLLGKDPYPPDPTVVVTRGSTYANRANLHPDYFTQIVSEYANTRLGLQELLGLVLDDVPGALWKDEMINQGRITAELLPTLDMIVVAVDPAATSAGESNETGIVVCGRGPAPKSRPGANDEPLGRFGASSRYRRMHGYVLADLTVKASPEKWAKAAVDAYHKFDANYIVAETNQGGEMVASTIRNVDPNVPIRMVSASKNKRTRAEPVVALYEQARVHHVGKLPRLESQMLTYDPEVKGVASPDRMDAMVWGMTKLLGKAKLNLRATPIGVGGSVAPWAGGMSKPIQLGDI